MLVENINKTIRTEDGYQFKLIENCSFEIPDHKVTTIVAPFKSGKSTLLKILCGIDDQDADRKTKIENAVLIPSEPSSFPWLSVKDNILFGNVKLEVDDLTALINSVGLTGYQNHFSHNKSLGFRFRIAIARSLAARPSIILLDDPFNKMNQTTLKEILQLLVDLNKQYNTTFLLITSNITEAILISHKLYVMKKAPASIVFQTEINHEDTDLENRLNSSNFANYCTQIEFQLRKIESVQLISYSK